MHWTPVESDAHVIPGKLADLLKKRFGPNIDVGLSPEFVNHPLFAHYLMGLADAGIEGASTLLGATHEYPGGIRIHS
jgi:hypothetical protein